MRMLRALCLMALALSCAGCVFAVTRGPYHSDDEPSREERWGRVSVESDWTVAEPDATGMREVSAEVAYVNSTDRRFSVVGIWCRVFDAEGYQLAARQWTLTAEAFGPIDPGFKTRLVQEVRVRKEPSRIECEIEDAR